jgi:hypothetical protein
MGNGVGALWACSWLVEVRKTSGWWLYEFDYLAHR